ncbi:restriction endonuclease subunit S [Leuconostoc mesenteroides]|uniref:restriction endonuclease subunit S n=1 Tax=Leuconostoc mesenteroides TaxID=1245 RepID=UPI002361EF00|nr:restriction endonuclease subunit S [Leuconostoc mesenteroides]
MSKKTPQIRFKGFTDDWEERKLGDHAKYRRGSFPQPYGNKEWYDGEGAMPFVQVVDVTNKLTLVENTKQKISKLAQSKSVFVPKGKVVVTLQGSIGRVAITQYDSFVDRTLLIFEDYEKETDERFWAYTIQKKFEIEKIKAPGGTIKTITKEALSSFDVHLPKFEEQQKIGSFFKQLDDTIALHQRKLDLLKEQKKGFLQKMFPKNGARVPELRFAGFTDDWEERKLIEVANYRNGKAHEKDISEDGDYIVVNSKFVSTNGLVKKYSDEMIAPLSKNEIAFVLSDVPNGRAIARTFLINKDNKYSLNQRIAGITPHADTNSYFLHSLMNRNHYFLRFDDGVSQTNLSKKEVEKWVELYPIYQEQQKIGSFFKQLDATIALHQRKLDLLKEQKKGFLQKMFVS